MSIITSSPTANSTSPKLSLLINDSLSSLIQLLSKTKPKPEPEPEPEPKPTSVDDSGTSAVRTNSNDTETSLLLQVKTIIEPVLRELNAGAGDQGSQLTDESVAHVRSKVASFLNQFIQLDPDNTDYYRRLSDDYKISDPLRHTHSSLKDSEAQGEIQTEASAVYVKGRKVFDFEAKFRQLSYDERRCLLCFSLFPEGSMVERIVLFYWWIALGLIDFSSSDGSGKAQGYQILANLVKLGFISRVIKNRACNSYKLRNGVYSKLIQQAKQDRSWHGKAAVLRKNGSFSIDGATLSSVDKIEVVLNVSKHNFDEVDTDNNLFSGMKKVCVAHLGNWDRNSKDYIVVKEPDFLKCLRQMKMLKLLSLRGMSGIVELPRFLYEHVNLQVLDLRACHNLEILPEGIEYLKQLTHLDISECYLLSGVPKGIARLTKLRVLKGFIVNPDLDTGSGDKNPEIMTTCSFSELSALQQLRKLSIRTRRMDFPTQEDLNTVAEICRLRKLKIAWVGSVSDNDDDDDTARVTDETNQHFIHNLEKLELRAAPKRTASKLLQLIIADEDNSLRKLYIIGGELEKLSSEEDCFYGVKQLRLRYLPALRWDWSECRRTFPDLNHLEVRDCAKLNDFPCDENGIWTTDS